MLKLKTLLNKILKLIFKEYKEYLDNYNVNQCRI